MLARVKRDVCCMFTQLSSSVCLCLQANTVLLAQEVSVQQLLPVRGEESAGVSVGNNYVSEELVDSRLSRAER